MMRLVAIAAVVLVSLGARAADALETARVLYIDGAFDEAASKARSLDTADGYALAAKSALVEGSYVASDGEKLDLFRQAARDARRAVALDPRHVDAHLQLAVALGNIAKQKDPLTAHVEGYARRGKALLDQALALDPDDAWAHGLLGIWHLQVVRHAGAALAKDLYGASEEEGLDHCARARRLAPGELVLDFGCAVSLLDIGTTTGGERRALAQLRTIIESRPDDAAEQLVQQEAVALLREARLRARE